MPYFVLDSVQRKRPRRDSDELVYEAERIKGCRVIRGKVHYLVKWANCQEETWEPAKNILDKKLIKDFHKSMK